MQSSVIDIVPLMLLIVFFGVQQRRQKQTYYRYWFFGWVFLFLSYVMWARNGKDLALADRLDVVRIDTLLLAVVTFVLSFLPDAKKQRRLLVKGLIVFVPALVVVDLQEVGPVSGWPTVLAMAALQAYGLYCLSVLLSPAIRQRYRWITAGYSICCVAILIDIWHHPIHDLLHYTLVQMLVASAVLYGVAFNRRTLAGFVAMAGYLIWAVYYIVQMWALPDHLLMHVLYQYWDIPKYLVAFSMILKVFEDGQDKQERQAAAFQSLYEDFRRVYEDHPHSMFICDPVTGRLLSANATMLKNSGYSLAYLLEISLGDLELPRDEELEAMERVVPQPVGGRRARFRHSDGSATWLNVYENEILFQGVKARFVTVRDVSDQLQFNNLLLYQANHDGLTGLPNRVELAGRLERCLEKSRRDGGPALVLTLDIDHFKQVNDTYGHATGDLCLKAVADRLKARIRQQDTIARTGGEEFTAVIANVHSQADAHKVAASLLQAFDQPVTLGELHLPVTISIGGALFPQDGADAATLRRRSDEALYAAKHAGRNCVRFAKGREQQAGSR